jgi:antitoxin (DNA-binding transcriptional repressor) of toxin-antitoxin stability system
LAHLSRLVEAIETGAATEVVIARNGRPVARLTALPGPERPRRLGVARSDMPLSAAQAIPWAQECGFELLRLDLPHLLTLEQLPLHHRDPFDRLLVAQSISESLLLVSADPEFHAYGGPLQR